MYRSVYRDPPLCVLGMSASGSPRPPPSLFAQLVECAACLAAQVAPFALDSGGPIAAVAPHSPRSATFLLVSGLVPVYEPQVLAPILAQAAAGVPGLSRVQQFFDPLLVKVLRSGYFSVAWGVFPVC